LPLKNSRCENKFRPLQHSYFIALAVAAVAPSMVAPNDVESAPQLS
jgi:hypothetical protein